MAEETKTPPTTPEPSVAPKKKRFKLTPKTRREALKSIAFGGGVIGAALLGFFPVVKGWMKRLRPPGAYAEDKFLSACIKCGQCLG